MVLAVIPIITVIFLDSLIAKTGMAEIDLFTGAELRNSTRYSSLDFLIESLLNPITSQLFITGYVLNVLFRRYDLIAVPGNGILFTLFNYDFGMGYLLLGMVSAGLARLTGNLIPAIALSIGCSIAKLLILTTYPRVTTVLVFLI